MPFGFPNEVFIFMVGAPLLFMAWYYRRILTSQAIKVINEDKTGDWTLFSGDWNQNNNRVTFKKSRKDKITLTKRGNYRRLFIPPMTTWRVFKAKEGVRVTEDWGLYSEKTSGGGNIDMGVQAEAAANGWMESIRSKTIMSIKSQYMGMIAGGGIGFSISQVIIMFLDVGF